MLVGLYGERSRQRGRGFIAEDMPEVGERDEVAEGDEVGEGDDVGEGDEVGEFVADDTAIIE